MVRFVGVVLAESRDRPKRVLFPVCVSDYPPQICSAERASLALIWIEHLKRVKTGKATLKNLHKLKLGISTLIFFIAWLPAFP